MAIFSDLTEDLVLLVLSCLAIKPLHRLKCVSRTFHALVLAFLWARRSSFPATGLIYETVYEDPCGSKKKKLICASKDVEHLDRFTSFDVDLSFLPSLPGLKVDHYCNGLLLCHGRAALGHPFSIVPLDTYFICNPLTKQWTALPRPRPWRSPPFSILVSDPSVSPHYKVIRYFHRRNDEEEGTDIELEIFSSETKKWTRSTISHGVVAYYLLERSVAVLKGVVYHLAYPAGIAAVDVNGEKPEATTVGLPDQMATSFNRCLGMSQGRVHYSSMYLGKIKVWRLNDAAAEAWELRHEVNVSQLIDSCPRRVIINARSTYYPFVPTSFSPEREVVYLEMTDGIIAFDLSTHRFEEFFETCCQCLYVFANLHVYPFFPSLYDPSSV